MAITFEQWKNMISGDKIIDGEDNEWTVESKADNLDVSAFWLARKSDGCRILFAYIPDAGAGQSVIITAPDFFSESALNPTDARIEIQ